MTHTPYTYLLQVARDLEGLVWAGRGIVGPLGSAVEIWRARLRVVLSSYSIMGSQDPSSS